MKTNDSNTNGSSTNDSNVENAGARPVRGRSPWGWDAIGLAVLILAVAIIDRVWLRNDASLAPVNDAYTYLTRLLNFLDAVPDRPVGELPTALTELSHRGRPPLYQLLTIPFILSLGRSIDAATAVNLLFLVLLAVMTWALGRRVRDGKVGLLAAMVVLSYPPVIHMARSYLPYAALAAWAALMLYVLLWTMESRSPRAACAFGATLCAGVMTHPNFTWIAAPVSVLFGLYMLLFQSSPRLPDSIASTPRWLVAKLRDSFFYRGLVPAALLVVVPSMAWYSLAGHRISAELNRVLVSSEVVGLRGFKVRTVGFAEIEPSFWWYAKTAPNVISTVLTAFLAMGLVAGVFWDRRPARVLIAVVVITYTTLSLLPVRVWWFFTVVAPAAAVVSVWWIFELRRKWIAAALAAVAGATAIFNFSLVTWGLPSYFDSVARWLGAPLERRICQARMPTILCPFPARATELWPLDAVTRKILDDSRCRDSGCQVLAIKVPQPNRMEYLAVRDSPGSRLKVVNVGNVKSGTPYALGRFLTSDYILFCDELKTNPIRRNSFDYKQATLGLLQFPPSAYATAHREVLSLETPACEVLRLHARISPARLQEAEDWVAALKVDEWAKRWALVYLERRYRHLARLDRLHIRPTSWTLEKIDTEVAGSKLTAEQAYLVYRLYAVEQRLEERAGRAIAGYRKAILYAPDERERARARRMLAGYYQDLGRLADAERIYRRMLEDDPHQVETRVRLSELYLDGGNFDASVAELETAFAAAPRTPSLGRLLERARYLQRRAAD